MSSNNIGGGNGITGAALTPTGLGAVMAQANKIAKTEEKNYHEEMIENLEHLLKKYGRVELIAANGTFDVRSGGIATYSPNLRFALRKRGEIEVMRVTSELTGEMQAKVAR